MTVHFRSGIVFFHPDHLPAVHSRRKSDTEMNPFTARQADEDLPERNKKYETEGSKPGY